MLIDGIPVVEYGPPALLALVVLMILTGRLVPRRTYDDKVHEAQEWRTESRIKDQQIIEKDSQIQHLSEVGRTVESIMRSIQKGPDNSGGGGCP